MQEKRTYAPSGKSLPDALARTTLMAGCFALLFSETQPANARDRVWFDPMLMEQGNPGQQGVDLSIFSDRGTLPPGSYKLHVWLNGSDVLTRDITLRASAPAEMSPVITRRLLKDLGVRVEAYPALATLADDAPVNDLGNIIPAAFAKVDTRRMILNVSIPQAALVVSPRGYVDPQYWNNGITTLFSNYSWSGSQNQADGRPDEQSQYVNLQNGLNVGPWRVRNYSTWTKDDAASHWNSLSSWVERDIKALRAQLVIGESYTPSALFDSVQFKGVQLASDDNMLPDSQRGFAPTIRGIANSNAQVTIRQNGYIIYQSVVAPGAFEINDLYPTSHSGDLEVTVKEADGREHVFIQPFSSVPVMQRPGQAKYNLTAGRYESGWAHDNEPEFVQGALFYGVNNRVTLYGGALGAEQYQAAALGVGIGMDEWGSVSLDITQAHSVLQDESVHDGQSFRFQYAKNIEATGTAVTLAGYRYSTAGYYTFEEANRGENDASASDYAFDQKRSQFQISINQSTREYGSYYINAWQRNYWDRDDTEKSLSAGMAITYATVSYNVSLNWNKTQGETDRQIALGISIPLSEWLPHSWATVSMSQNKAGDSRLQTGLSGSAFDDGRLGYAFSQSVNREGDSHDVDSDSNAEVNYKSRYANLNLGYYRSDTSRQWSYGAAGAVVVHPHGITLSQPLGDAFALVSANGASDIRLVNQPGVSTDWFGYAVVPWLTPYQENRLTIDTTTLPPDVDTETTSARVIPNKGALVEAQFDARRGYRILLTLHRANGDVVPFGAIVTRKEASDTESIVDEGGVVYLSGINDQTTLQVKWGRESTQHCQANVILPPALPEGRDMLDLTAACI